MTAARILLADDHELFREGLARLIDAQPDMAVVGQAEDGLEALKLARDLQPDLIVMDIKMPVCDGLEATQMIRAVLPAARIVMLTVVEDDEKLLQAVKAGANGYLLKEIGSHDFIEQLRGALEGDAVMPPRLAARLLDEFVQLANRPPEPAGDRPTLTTREHEVLNLVATGATNREIAARLSLSVHTVKSHVRSILTKLHAVNRRHATELAAQHGLVRVNSA